jgi:hypothetical protein
MIALRFVHLIESHSDQLAESLQYKLRYSTRSADLWKAPESEICDRTHELYRNLGDWLLNKTDADIQRVYMRIGHRRAEQGVSMSSLCWAIMMAEENLWEFLENEGMRENPIEILGGLELLRLLDQFFDRAVYYATVGYESFWRVNRTEGVALTTSA